jgi:hypothetical protein
MGAVVVLSVAAFSGGTEPADTNDERAAGEVHLAYVEAARAKLQTLPEPVRWNIETWYNSTGLAQLDPGVWQARLDRACAQEFWANPGVLRDEFVTSDFVAPIRTPDMGPVEMQNAYDALWVMALNHCRDIIPLDVIGGKPPDFHLGD